MYKSDRKYFTFMRYIFFIISFICFFIAFLSVPFMFSKLQDIVIKCGERLVGRNLNISYWHDVILARARCTFLLSTILGIGFILLAELSFDCTSSFYVDFKLPVSRKLFITAFIPFLLISGINFFWFSQKKSFHADELYEIGIINRNEYGFWRGDRFSYSEKEYEQSVPISGHTIMENAFFDDGSVKDALKDVVHLYIYCNDNPHTGLYYILQRLAFFGVNTCNKTLIMNRMFSLNFMIFMISFYVMFLLVIKLADNDFVRMILIIAAFANPATIGNVLFFRPFILQELALIVFAYTFICFYSAISTNVSVMSMKAFFQGTLAIGFALVSEYFSIFFIVFLGFTIIILCIRKKNFECIKFLITMFFCGFIVAKLLYLDYGIGFFDSRHEYALNSIKDNLYSAINSSRILIDSYFINFFVFCVLILIWGICHFIFARRSNSNGKYETSCVLFITTLLFIFLCNYFAPFKNEIRYIASSFVFLPVITVLPIEQNTFTRKIFISLFQITIFVVIVFKVLPYFKNEKSIRHLDDAPYTCSHAQYNKDFSIPVVIKQPLSKFAVYPYVNENQTYYFIDSKEKLDNLGLSEFWYIEALDSDGSFSSLKEFLITKEY